MELHNVGVCEGEGDRKRGREEDLEKERREVGVNENVYINIETP